MGTGFAGCCDINRHGRAASAAPVRAGLAALLLLCAAPAAAETALAVALEGGYRFDALDWNIAGWNSDSGNPDQQRSGEYVNVLSELSWSDVQIAQVGLSFEARDGRLYLRGQAFYGEVLDGDNRDSDYDYDNRQGEFSRSDNGVFGDTLDAGISLGYRYDVAWGDAPPIHIMPVVGAAIHQQNFGMNDGYQTLYVPYAERLSHPQAGVPDTSVVGPDLLAGLNSSYDTEWTTGWVGLDIWRTLTPRLSVRLNAQFHAGDYAAVANWNLRQDLAHPVSFAHWADGQGLVLGVGGEYALSPALLLKFGVNYGTWDTDPGIDRVYFSDGSRVETPLNQVNWESLAFNLGLALRL